LPRKCSPQLARRAFVRSHVGRVRPRNEDSCAVSGSSERLSDWSGNLKQHGGWALLADGLGGHVAGEVASALAIEVMRPMMAQARSEEDIRAAISAADSALYLAMDMQPALQGMGTTIAGVLLAGSSVIAFNVGDSRIYSFNKGALTKISIDDAVAGNRLTQCLGGAQSQTSLTIHVSRPNAGSSQLLCSDGLTDMLSDAEIAAILATTLKNPATSLVEAALEAGGHDNVSIIFIGQVHEA
jgi:PPM family protein phosphatase